jgi:hypothetical protein
VLSLALVRLAADWQARYGITPVLVETFVDATRWHGTCYKAANWVYLGKTQGRGRQDREHRAGATRKDIWVYPLRPDWQASLRAGSAVPGAPVAEAADWAAEEFGRCALPDARLKVRLLTLARDWAPLGFVDVQCWAREAQAFGKKARPHQLPIEEKESFKWLKSYRALSAVQARHPRLTLVRVGEREADLYALFAQAAAQPKGPALLVRGEHNRQLEHEQARLWPTLQDKPVAGVQVLQVPRQGARAAREAHLRIRIAAVSLAAPTGHKGAPAIPLWLGLQRLDDIAAMWQVMSDATQTTVSSAIDSG